MILSGQQVKIKDRFCICNYFYDSAWHVIGKQKHKSGVFSSLSVNQETLSNTS